MKMHLLNILKQLDANDSERELAKKYFSDKIVSFSAVRSFLLSTRIKQ
jgi:hydroxymethylglutaryl-CoA reductase